MKDFYSTWVRDAHLIAAATNEIRSVTMEIK